jgi:hypothetical protein
MISCVSPADNDMEESINTLRYAERARSISNSIKRNVTQAMLTPNECAALTAENLQLKALVVSLKKRIAAESSRDTLLDQEEGVSSLCVQAGAIFRLPSESSASTASSSSPAESSRQTQEIKPDQPIWKHFKDLAKVTRNVSFRRIVKRYHTLFSSPLFINQVSFPIEISTSSEIEHDESKLAFVEGGQNERALKPGPQTCLSYEMSLTRAPTEELVEREETVHSMDNEQKINTTHLQGGTNELQYGIAALKAERERMESLLRNSNEELRMASQDAAAKQASCEALNKELISLQAAVESTKAELVELHKNSKMEQERIQEEVAHLDRFVEQLTQGISHVDLCSPQRSLARILAATHDHQVIDQEDGPSFGESGLQTNPQSSLSTLQEKFGQLEMQLNSLSGGLETAPNTDDSKDFEIDELGQQLAYANKQLRLSDRNKSLTDAQVVALQERVSRLETDFTQARKEKDDCVASYEERISGLVKSLESALSVEENMRKNYEILSASMSREKSQTTDFQYQIEALRQSNSRLESALNERSEQLAAQRAECTELQSRNKLIESEKEAREKGCMLSQQSIKAVPSPKVESLPFDDPTQAKTTLAILTQIASGFDSDLNESPQSADNNVSYQPDYMKTTHHVTKVLQLADAAICAADGKSITSTSCCSSAGTEFRPPVPSESKTTLPHVRPSKTDTQPTDGESSSNKVDSVEITNLSLVDDQKQCACSSTLFANKAEYVEFYLPQITVECTCGKLPPRLEEGLDPCALTSILRPWQIDFLAHEGIRDAIDFVHACDHRGDVLAAALRRWRRQKGLRKIRTKSCCVAIHIWERTCRKVLRSVTKQKAQGILVPKKPEFLELNITEDATAVSSLGGGTFRATGM